MARRASSSAHPIWLVIAALLGAAGIAGGFLLFRGASDPFRAMNALPVKDYLENSNSLRGNVYKVDGNVARSLAWSPTAGRLLSVEVGEDVLPILVPAELKKENMERGQRYFFKIEVGDKGVLRAQDVKKA